MSLSNYGQSSETDRSVLLPDADGSCVLARENRGRVGSEACLFFKKKTWVKRTFSKWDFISVTVLSVNHPTYVIFPAAPPIMATFAMKNKEINSS